MDRFSGKIMLYGKIDAGMMRGAMSLVTRVLRPAGQLAQRAAVVNDSNPTFAPFGLTLRRMLESPRPPANILAGRLTFIARRYW